MGKVRERRFLSPAKWKEEVEERRLKAATDDVEPDFTDLPPLYKQVAVEVKEPDEEEAEAENNTLSFVISTDDVDRDRDTISVEGWDLENYQKNPVVLWAHDYRQLPVARASNPRVEDGKLKSDATFTDAETYAFGNTVYRMYVEGFLHAVSVGFMPNKWSFVEEDARPFGVDFEEQELLEYSCVPVPSNPHAIQEAASKGIDMEPVREWAHSVLERDPSGLWVSRSAVEDIARTLDGPKPAVTYGRDLGDGYGGSSPASWTGGMPPRGSQRGRQSEKLAEANEKNGEATITVKVDDVVNGKTLGQLSDMARFFKLLTEIRVRATSLADLKDGDLTSARDSAIRREANFIAAKLLPDFGAEDFEKLFPELCGEGEFVPGVVLEAKSGRVLSKANEDKLKAARDEIDAVLEQIGDGDDEPSEVETEGFGDATLLGFLQPIRERSASSDGESTAYDPFAVFGFGDSSAPEEVARE